MVVFYGVITFVRIHSPTVLYRVIHEERSVFLEVIVSVIVREKKSCEHVSNSDWLPRCRFSSLGIQKQCAW
jgi:hypothetical protein